MRLKLKEENTGGELLLFKEEPGFDRLPLTRDRFDKYFTIAWNPTQNSQRITIDGAEFDFPANSLVTLLFNQSFGFENSACIVAWQFNREFYCIIDHDNEVSCVGFLFSSTDHLFIELDVLSRQKLQLLLDVFIQEFETSDNIQNEMLLVLLKRLIIYTTRLAKSGYIPVKKLQDERFHIIRKFNLLVEANFKSEHSVSFYADALCKSPKTLSNLFAIFAQKTPSQIIQERIMAEAKRLLFYTDKSVKNITYDLGFEDVAYFSNFFKKNAGQSPSDFRNAPIGLKMGNNHN
ncbi:helix-turn-helix domain-containing protein [Pedobacter sp. HDW13]|uniref:helix-turn-helix domain-containing protein n=1 Tax=unclassified Pedobacter TaxID=2628915 RepID=UPI000F5966F6|nr:MULTISPECIES: helix-turn-helix domain-containing protein [unclassified Pedobacter]QIL37955.1 helix-turn-helix domain-containing protein [Pedobacter sp. HDW13]RQO68955.1 AraC family transcriptional regulator [Pedobacter sp. KBW01]